MCHLKRASCHWQACPGGRSEDCGPSLSSGDRELVTGSAACAPTQAWTACHGAPARVGAVELPGPESWGPPGLAVLKPGQSLRSNPGSIRPPLLALPGPHSMGTRKQGA